MEQKIVEYMIEELIADTKDLKPDDNDDYYPGCDDVIDFLKLHNSD